MQHLDHTSLTSWVKLIRDAHFLTHFFNYDQAWPKDSEQDFVIARPDVVLDIPKEPIDVDTTAYSLKQKSDRIAELRALIRSKKQSLKEQKARITELCAASKHSLPSCPDDLDSFQASLDSHQRILQSRLDQSRRLYDHLVFSQQQIRLHIERFRSRRNEIVSCTDRRAQQNKYIQKWNSQRLGTITLTRSAKDHVTLRIESSPADPSLNVEHRTSTAPLVRGVLCPGRLILSDLDVVCTQHDNVSALARCASAALAPSALVASLLFSLDVDRRLSADLRRLRSQYPLDWDPVKRQLHVLGGLHGEVLATLHITSNGSFSLVRVQYKQQPDGTGRSTLNDCTEVNRKMQSKLVDFIPPASDVLDEWISDVRDFCNSLSELSP